MDMMYRFTGICNSPDNLSIQRQEKISHPNRHKLCLVNIRLARISNKFF
jgi:hypothetical protein